MAKVILHNQPTLEEATTPADAMAATWRGIAEGNDEDKAFSDYLILKARQKQSGHLTNSVLRLVDMAKPYLTGVLTPDRHPRMYQEYKSRLDRYQERMAVAAALLERFGIVGSTVSLVNPDYPERGYCGIPLEIAEQTGIPTDNLEQGQSTTIYCSEKGTRVIESSTPRQSFFADTKVIWTKKPDSAKE
ncbi:MAG: hypothetical protein LBM73_02220 [Candidatus Nomurabacteria bacterium]|jgi:hypothetical protein|nr:hypothetical protein [Candidatus Nomurabacteria bacterium]